MTPRQRCKRRRAVGKTYLAVASLLVATVAVSVAYVQREYFLVQWYAYRCVNTNDADEDAKTWLKDNRRLAVPVVLAKLREPEPDLCARAGQLLIDMVTGHADPTHPADVHVSLALAGDLQLMYHELSDPGRAQAMWIARGILVDHLDQWSPNAPTAVATAGQVLLRGLSDRTFSVQDAALKILPEVWKWSGNDSVAHTLVMAWKRECYDNTLLLAQATERKLRADAVLALAGAPYHEGDRLIIGLMDDSAPEVQKAALQVLGFSSHAAGSLDARQKDQVLGFLHHEDPEIHQAARQLLLTAGVPEPMLALAELLQHPEPAQRAKVARRVFAVQGIDPVAWLLVLADDTDASVRLAMVRAANRSADPRLRQRLAELAKDDADPDVRTACQGVLSQRPSGLPVPK